MWQERLSRNETAYRDTLDKMDSREAMYAGDDELKPLTRGERMERTPHVRNICTEIIEAEIDSAIPQPKVTARRKKDEAKAKLIEDMIRNELDRMPFEEINDIQERTVPIQGGSFYLLEWDNTKRTHTTVGELSCTPLHPKKVIPQDGIFTSVEDMDYIILKIPQTKEYIRRRYGVDVKDESEAEPDIRGDDESTADDLVTQYVAYYRNDTGGIGLYSWVGDTTLEDLDDYQARRLRRCAMCGAAEQEGLAELEEPTLDGNMPGELGFGSDPLSQAAKRFGGDPSVSFADSSPYAGEPLGTEKPNVRQERRKKKACPYCGGDKWEESREDVELLYTPVLRSDGTEIPGAVMTLNDEGEGELKPTEIPFYKPNIFPVFLQRNVSLYGSLLGDSDIDKIADQQNTINRLEAKIIEKLVASGSYITLPDDVSIKVDTDDMKVIRPGTPAAMSMIGVYNMEGNISQDMAYLEQVYQEARQIIGITDSYQGRQDSTATSGKAKEFAAAQSAGRLESKRRMKDFAYSQLFEAMFKYKLAYADEPRPVVTEDVHGNQVYEEFNRYDFLEQDAAGEWYWNDQFLFSCDSTAPLAANRGAMWQDTLNNLQTGAYGDPSQMQTLLLYWTKMENLHYPGASETKRYLEEELQRQQQIQAAQMKVQMAQQDMERVQSQMQRAGTPGV
nr:MAG TPA: Portal protein [Caudoviricetes sp.]